MIINTANVENSNIFRVSLLNRVLCMFTCLHAHVLGVLAYLRAYVLVVLACLRG